MNEEYTGSQERGYLQSSKWRYNNLVELIVNRLGKTSSVYFDYDFVCNFTLPDCREIVSVDPGFQIVPDLPTLRQRIFDRLSVQPKKCDDFLDVVLDALVISWFLASYKYIWGPFIMWEKIHPLLLDKTFRDLFSPVPDLLHQAEALWGTHKIDEAIYDSQYIDSHGFILGVGNWDIILADTASEFIRNISPEVQFYKDFKTKKVFIKNRITGAETDITRRKIWSNDMFKIFSHLFCSDIRKIDVYEITELLRVKKILRITDKLVAFQKNQLYTFDDLLFWIGVDPKNVYLFEDNIFTLLGEQEYKTFVGR